MTQRVNRRLTDLATAARKSGLKVTELPGWRDNASAGGEAYLGIGIHHTGSYDDVGDTSSDEAYAKWMAFEGRDDLDPPLMNLGLSAEGEVFVGASGNANGMGEVRASGPMPYARDGNAVYIVIEAYNSGTQGWGTKGKDRAGNTITQYEAYVRLCAALCLHYGWPASHVRAHWETSVTGKWDPGDPKGILRNGQRVMDMDRFRADVARVMREGIDDMPEYDEWSKEAKTALVDDVVAGVLRSKVKVMGAKGEPVEVTVKQALARVANTARRVEDKVEDVSAALDKMNE